MHSRTKFASVFGFIAPDIFLPAQLFARMGIPFIMYLMSQG